MKERQEFVKGLREFADFLEEHPAAPLPCFGSLNSFVYNKEMLVAAARAMGGRLEKKVTAGFYFVRKTFGPIHYDVNVERDQVCERIVVGKRTVPALPAQPEHEEDVIEWKCSGSLLGGE